LSLLAQRHKKSEVHFANFRRSFKRYDRAGTEPTIYNEVQFQALTHHTAVASQQLHCEWHNLYYTGLHRNFNEA